jgi:hypothetical protein
MATVSYELLDTTCTRAGRTLLGGGTARRLAGALDEGTAAGTSADEREESGGSNGADGGAVSRFEDGGAPRREALGTRSDAGHGSAAPPACVLRLSEISSTSVTAVTVGSKRIRYEPRSMGRVN